MINTATSRNPTAIPSAPRLSTVTRLLVFTPALLMLLSLHATRASAQQPDAEYALKAAFLSKFPYFAEWPEAALVNRHTIDVCVLKPSPFGATLQELIAGERLGERTLALRLIEDDDALTDCHVLFIPSRPRVSRKRLLARASALPILTVGDDGAFLDEGGILKLQMIDGRVRFDVDVAAASRAGLRLSSQLLQLAMQVRGGPH